MNSPSARDQTIATELRRSDACWMREDFRCVDRISRQVLGLAPNNAEALDLRQRLDARLQQEIAAAETCLKAGDEACLSPRMRAIEELDSQGSITRDFNQRLLELRRQQREARRQEANSRPALSSPVQSPTWAAPDPRPTAQGATDGTGDTRVQWLLQRAEERLSKGQPDLAAEYVNEALTLDPNNPSAMQMAAKIAGQQEQANQRSQLSGTWVINTRFGIFGIAANFLLRPAKVGDVAGEALYAFDTDNKVICRSRLTVTEVTAGQVTFSEKMISLALICPAADVVRMQIISDDEALVQWFRKKTPDKVSMEGSARLSRR